MSLCQKLCFMVIFIYLCQFVKTYKISPICTRYKYLLDKKIGYRKVPVNSCCYGYTEDKLHLDSLKCDPVCSSGCPNGICRTPENCQCNKGYTIDPVTFRCVPSCSNPCYNGDCVVPNTCRCRPGFRALNATYCEPFPPLCSPPCFNGDCVGPNKCKCHDGFKLSGWVWPEYGYDHTCIPHTPTSTTTTYGTEYDVKSASETTAESSTSYPSPEVTDKNQVFKNQDVSNRAEDAETITEPDSTTEEVNEATSADSNVTDGNITVNILFGGFTELDDDSGNDENIKNSGTKVWIYVSASILLVAVILLVAFRRRLLGYIKGKTYVVQGQQTRKASTSTNTFNVALSSISNKNGSF